MHVAFCSLPLFPGSHHPRLPPRAACPAPRLPWLLHSPEPQLTINPGVSILHAMLPTPKPPWHRAASSHFHLFFTIRFQNFNKFTLVLTISVWRRIISTNQVFSAVLLQQWDTHGHCLSHLCKSTGNLAILAMLQEQKMPSFHLRGILQAQRNLSFFYFLTHYFAITPFIRK